MLAYIHFYHFYTSVLIRTIRGIGLFFLFIIVLWNMQHLADAKLALFILSLWLIFEVFFHFYIAKIAPRVPLSQNTSGDLLLSCTREVLQEFLQTEKTGELAEHLIASPPGTFILQKAAITLSEIQRFTFAKEDLLSYAEAQAKGAGGSFITRADIVAAYILLIEPQTKLLFTKHLKPEEFINILYWTRIVFKDEEFPQTRRVHFSGKGIGEAITTGWTPETKKFTGDFSYRAFALKPRMKGREKEFNLMLEGLSRRENNNVLLIGNPGSGRENLVALLVQESYKNTIPHGLTHMRVLELMIGPLIAGAANRAELESRLQMIIEEVQHSGNVILYIPELQNIIGSSAYDVDLSGALFPYLQDGKMSVIASVSVGNFKAYVEKSPLLEVFLPIKLEDPDKQTAMSMLLEKAAAIESTYQTIVTYKAIETAVEYADRYFQDAALPGSAANLLEDVAHRVSGGKKKRSLFGSTPPNYLLPDQVIQLIQEKTHIAVADPTGEEKSLLLHLEEKLHQRVIAQEDAIVAISEAMRRLRAGLTTLKRPISFLFLGPTGVGKTETAKALAELYFGGEDKMIRLDMSEYADAEGVKRLLGAPPGEGGERGELTDKIADHPFSLVLLDEFEKAYPKILDLFLQVFEDGRLTDNKGKTVSFVNSIIIATSNAGAEFIREEIQKNPVVDTAFSKRLLDHLQTTHLFKPELINRFDDVVIFKPLGQNEMVQITKIMLKEVAKTLFEQDITFTYDERLLKKIMDEGFDMQFGARPLRRYIQDNVEDVIAQKKLRDEIKRGDKIMMSTDEQGNIVSTVIP